MKFRPAIAQYEATVVLVVISLSLATVVYSGLKRGSDIHPGVLFVNEETTIGGNPPIERLEANSSSTTTISSLSLDSASSTDGILAFDGSSYSTSKSICEAGVTTFFSVLDSQSGTLLVETDGKSWVSGTWGSAVNVTSGWQEVMIQGGTRCTVELPGGQAIPMTWTPSSTFVSSVPLEGSLGGTTFTFYLPTGQGAHSLLVTSSGGLDDASI
ncbi:MAG TPA: hypothetical protein VGS04_00755 [Nitrososphaerales archaeon]|nr:hypothetical protein [Nitrososphaerales archaeon]